MIRMMQVIKLANSTEFATKIRKVSNFYTEVIHFKLEALQITDEFVGLRAPVVNKGVPEMQVHWQGFYTVEPFLIQ